MQTAFDSSESSYFSEINLEKIHFDTKDDALLKVNVANNTYDVAILFLSLKIVHSFQFSINENGNSVVENSLECIKMSLKLPLTIIIQHFVCETIK